MWRRRPAIVRFVRVEHLTDGYVVEHDSTVLGCLHVL